MSSAICTVVNVIGRPLLRDTSASIITSSTGFAFSPPSASSAPTVPAGIASKTPLPIALAIATSSSSAAKVPGTGEPDSER